MFAMLAFILIMNAPHWLASRKTVDIPDPVLAAGLRDALSIRADQHFRQQLLERVTYLDLTSKTRIRDLTGLEACTALRELRLILAADAEPARTQVQVLLDRGVIVVVSLPPPLEPDDETQSDASAP